MSARVALIAAGPGDIIGKATAALLLETGWSVLLCGRDPDRLESAAASLDGDERLAVEALDIRSPEDARRVVARTIELFDRLDGLVNARGIVDPGSLIERSPDDDWDEALRVLMEPIWTSAAALPHLRETRGAIVNVSSNGGDLQPELASGPYCVPKPGLAGFTRQAAHEFSSSGVRVNAVETGWVVTPFVQGYIEAAGVSPDPSMPSLHRLVQPVELAATVAFLLSDDASHMTGESLVLDGRTIEGADLGPAG